MVFKQQKDVTRDLSMVPMRTGCILHGRRVPRPATYDMDSVPMSDGVPLTGFEGVAKLITDQILKKRDPELEEVYANAAM